MVDQEKTLKELREELVGLGISAEKAEKFTTKAQLVTTIEALRAAGDKVESLDPKINPKEEKEDLKRWQSKSERMREHLESQPKVRVLIPLDPNEKQGVVREIESNGRKETVHVSGAVWSKTFNGYRVIVPKGVYWSVPEQIAENIEQEYNQTQHAGDQWRIDRVDPETGKSVKSQLE